MILRRKERPANEALADTLLELAGAVSEAGSAGEALDRLTRGLAERGVGCAVFLRSGDGTVLELERTTLPFVPDAFGQPLRLPRLLAAINRGRPVLQPDVSSVFGASGGSRPLLAEDVPGPIVLVPFRLGAGRAGVLGLTSRDLHDRDVLAAWGLALQLGSAMRATVRVAPVPEAAPSGGDLSLFHDLTRRLSYSLSADEVVRTGIDVLTPALGAQLAASVACRGNEDVTFVYAPQSLPDSAVSSAADAAVEAFLRLTGGKHRSCARPPFQREALEAPPPRATEGAPPSVLDAPLVIQGDVTGLLRVVSWEPDAFDEAEQRTFFTVATQVSLALDRISAQRQAEREHLASLADSLSDGVVLVDAALRVTSLNAVAQQLLPAVGSSATQVGAELSAPALAELTREALSSQRPTPLRELPSADDASTRRYLVAMAAPLAGSPEGSAAVLVLRDVTDERLMQERLLQSEKMVSVGQLVSGVAHELNNPLTGIMGFAQLLLARELDEKTKHDVETIHEEADRAAKIVQNLLSFARRKRAEKELYSLNVLIERVLELRNYELRVKNIDLEVDLDPDLPETMVDANQMQQVFFNVIINAEQAMLSKGDHGTLRIRSRREGDAIRLSFQDDGPGMSPEDLRRIFDPFYTTKDTGEGTGLGLTISYGIIDEHGGRIWADSQPGRGTTFFIELPVVQGAEPVERPPEEEPEAQVAGVSVLVVDDEESIQRLLGSVLQMDGHQVDTARNGSEALERIAARRYDVIITDIKMPDMDGRELYRHLLDMDRALAERTVFITGDTVSPDTRHFLQEVTNPCLAKPFRVREVRETIAHVLGE